jgi:Zn-dependent protease
MLSQKVCEHMKCQKCQKEVFLPFKCPHCGNYFCSEHRLPENHVCPRIEQARTPKEQTQPVIVQKQRPYEYTITYTPTQLKRGKIHFSSKEIKHLTVAALLVIGVGLSLGLFSNLFHNDYVMLATFTIVLTMSFFLHEIAHKIVAQREGLWAEFRLMLIGAVLTLVSIITPLFKIISPGAVVVAGSADLKSMGKTSIAGPTTNIALSTMFLAVTFLFPQQIGILALAAFFNAWIALFNLIPFGVLDGFKIFQWDKKLWVLAFTASLVLMLISYWLIF